MPDTPLDKLEIKITSSSEGAEKKVNALADALERLSNMSSLKGIEGVAKKISTIGEASKKISITVDPSSDKALDGIIDKVGILQRAIEKVNATAINIPSLSKQTGARNKTTTQTVQADASISGTSEVASGQVEKVKGNVSALNNVKKSAEEASASINKMKKTLSDQWSTWSSLKGMVHGVGEAIKNTFAKAAESSEKFAKVLRGVIPVVGVITTVLRGIWKIGGGIFSIFKKVASTIAGGFVGGVKKLASGLKSIGSHVLNYITKPFTRAIAVIQKWKAALVRVAFYRLVRSAIKMVTDGFKEGIENLYYFSSLTESQFKPAMDSLASSSLYLKNSLGAMAAPLIQAVAPAVNYLIDLFVTLLNVINAVFSLLGGRTYTKALKTSAKYADDLDKSLGGGAASAKELQRYLIGIDQLTIMPDEPSSGGGGGGGDLLSDYEDMFEEVPLPDWVLNIKDAINAGDWYGAGELLAEKVNTVIDKLKENAPAWGNKIGQAIQNGIEFSLGFIRDMDIEGVGASVATIIGNSLNNIHPRDLGAIIANGIKSAFRFAHGFLQGYTGPEIGSYLAEVVNGWFAELSRDGGWKKAGEDLNKVILGIINGVANFLQDLDTAQIEQGLKDFFGEIKWGDIWSSMENLAKVAADAIPWQEMLDSLWRFAANTLVFLRREVLGIPDSQASQPWRDLQGKLSRANETINWADILSGLIAFVGDIVSTIKDSMPDGGWEEIWNNVKDSLSESLGFDSWKDLKGELSEKVIGVLKSAIDIVEQAVYEHLKSGGWFQQSMASYLFPEKYHIDVASSTFENNLGNGLSSAFENAWGAAKRAGMSEKEFLSWVESLTGTLYGSVGEVFAAAKAGLIDPVQNAFDQIDTMDKNVDVTVDATTSPEFDEANKQLRDINDKTATLKTIVQDPYERARREIQQTFVETNDKSVTLKATVKDVAAKARESAMEAWEALKNKSVSLTAKVIDGASSVRTTMLNAWKDLKDKTANLRATVSDMASGARNTMLEAWSRLEDKVATLRASVVDGASNARQTMLDAWATIKDKVAVLTARAENVSAGVFSNLTGLWDTLKDKVATLTGTGNTQSSLTNTKSAFDSVYSKTVTVTVDGSQTNSFGQAKRDYQALQNKTVTVTYNSKGTAVSGAKAALKASGGIFAGGSWHDIAGYAGGGNPKRARLFYANENGIPELIGRIGSNTAVMNNGQIVASVSSGVYRAVSAAMGGLGTYFANISSGLSRIPEALSNITPVQPQPIMVGAGGPTYEMDMSAVGRTSYDGMQRGDDEDSKEIINAIYAMGQRIITAINENGGDLIVDGDTLGTKTTSVQNRQTRMYGKSVLYT